MATNRREDWHTRIKGVEREFVAARKAVDDFLAALTHSGVRAAGEAVADERLSAGAEPVPR